MTETSCSWCHTMNDVSQTYCATCGHMAHEARMNCSCETCAPGAHEEPEDVDITEPFTDWVERHGFPRSLLG